MRNKSKAGVIFKILAALLGMALIAAGCGGDSGDEAEGGSTTTEVAAAPTTTADATGTIATDTAQPTTSAATAPPSANEAETSASTAEQTGSGCDVEPFQDPRGGIFQEHQDKMDRCHPFQSLDAFCLTQDAPGVPLEATDRGITEDSISFVHLRTTLEDLESLGFATDVGDPTKMFETFVWYVNNVCGGVHGRQIDLSLIEVPPTGSDVDALRNAACIEATEDRDAVIVLNSTGFSGTANLCFAEQDPKAAFVSSQNMPLEYLERGEGRLIALALALEESLQFLAQAVIAEGLLEGKTVGVLGTDSPGEGGEAVSNFVSLLEDAGVNVAVYDTIGCAGGLMCTDGTIESVSKLIEENVDVLFPTLNTLSLPNYIGEMVRQGFEPGDITFYNSNASSQARDIVASKIVQFGGEDAGRLYDGTVIIDEADTGARLEDDYAPIRFNQMCYDTYLEHHENVPGDEDLTDPPHDAYDPDGNTQFGMVAQVCAFMRVALRAVYDAGPNPTRDEIYEALVNLGPIDSNGMFPHTIRPGKTQSADVIHKMIFSYPCAAGEEFATDQGTCIMNAPDDEWRLVER